MSFREFETKLSSPARPTITATSSTARNFCNSWKLRATLSSYAPLFPFLCQSSFAFRVPGVGYTLSWNPRREFDGSQDAFLGVRGSFDRTSLASHLSSKRQTCRADTRRVFRRRERRRTRTLVKCQSVLPAEYTKRVYFRPSLPLPSPITTFLRSELYRRQIFSKINRRNLFACEINQRDKT